MATPTLPPAAAAPSPAFDFAKALRFVFDDPDWVKKVLFGGLFALLSALIVGVFFLAGYTVRLIRNAARGEARPLPDWDDLGGIFQDGLPAVGVYLVYGIGAALVPATVGCVAGALGGGLGSLFGGRSDDVAGAGMAVGFLVFYLLIFVFMLALMLFLPAAFTRFALAGRFGAAFEVREAFAFITRNLGNYLLTLVAYLLASFVSQFGILLLCVGIFPAAFWSYCVLGWGLGETARLDSARG